MRFIADTPSAPTADPDPLRRYPRLFDGGLLLVWLLCLLALRPLVVQAGLPNGPDVLYHTYRTAEMSRSWEHGVWLPRWAEGFYYGYGSPVFHYYASFTYYIGAALMLGLGLTALEALRWQIVLCVFLAATGMYLFLRQQIGRLAGVLGALAYVYAPYMLFTEPYARGAYPELFALALLPLILWAYGRVRRTGHGVDVILAAALHGLLILSHNLMAIVQTGIIGLWLAWQISAPLWTFWRERRRPPAPPLPVRPYDDDATDDADPPPLAALLRHTSWRAVLALALALGGTAFFWLPVLLETSAVQLENVTGVAELAYQNHFVPLGELLGFAPILDNGAINGLLHVLSLGVAQWVAALIGLGAALYWLLYDWRKQRPALDETRRQAARLGLLMALLTFVLVGLMTPAAAFIWDSVRAVAYLQFPWRLLGPVAFTCAFLVGLNALWIERLARNASAASIALLVAAPLVLAFPLLNVPEWLHREVDASISGYLQAELVLRQSGTTYTNEYRPRAVFNPPGPTPRLIADYQDGYPINKANVPDDVQAVLILNTPQFSEWRVTTPRAITFEMLNYDWLGWTAEVNGVIVPITPSPEHGLITFPLPAGTHVVKVYLATTPARTLGYAISAMAGVGMLAALALLRPLRRARLERAPLTVGQRRAVLIGGLIVIALAVPLLRAGTMWRATPPGQAPAQQPVEFALGANQEFRLIGYDLNATSLRPGDTVQLTLYWFPAGGGSINYATFVHVALPATPPIAQADKLHPGGRAIQEWWQQPSGYILDEYSIRLPDEVAAGTYTLFVGFYTCETRPPGDCGIGDRPPAFAGDGTPTGDSIPLTTLTITR